MTDINYEKYLFQKYSVAVAIAVIKRKPDNKSLPEYINELKNIIQSQKDPFENISICSRDFINDSDKEINDEHINRTKFEIREDLAKTNDTANVCKKVPKNSLDRNTDSLIETVNGCGKTNYGLNKPTEHANNSSSLIDDPPVINFEEHDQNLVRNESIKDIIDIFKDTEKTHETDLITSTPRHLTQSTHFESVHSSQKKISDFLPRQDGLSYCTEVLNNKMPEIINIKNAIENNEVDNRPDSQATLLYTLNGFTDNFTHISQSQDNIFVLNNGVRKLPKKGKKDDEVNDLNNAQNKETNEISTQHFSPNNCSASFSINGSSKIKYQKTIQSEISAKIFKKSDTRICNINEKNKEIIFFAGSYRQNTPDSEQSNPIHKDAQHIPSDSSTSGYGFILKQFDKVNNSINETNTKSFKKQLLSNFNEAENCKEIFRQKAHNNSLLSLNLSQTENNQSNNPQREFERLSFPNANRSEWCDDQFSFLESHEKIKFNVKDNRNNKDGKSLESQIDVINITEIKDDLNKCKCQQSSIGYNTECMSKNILEELDGMEDGKSDIAEIQDVTIPFKVLEELNRVKYYINKQDRRLSDSGRSNSQSFSFRSGSQLSGGHINESGHCLLNFLGNCCLTDNTIDIAEEISHVLGKAVDKLHEDENYPPFLEKILERVHDLIGEICDGPRNTENLFTKEEKVDRLLLLNRSANIIKYTIEKIIPILEEVHLKLKNKDILEINHLERTENLCYILHILEILLKRNKTAITLSSQTSTQVSQSRMTPNMKRLYSREHELANSLTQSQEEDRSLKRSTVTEIWRKKWNLSKNEGMDGYSLISFAALQCFNLLQLK